MTRRRAPLAVPAAAFAPSKEAATGDTFALLDGAGCVVAVSPSFEDLIGRPAEAIIGQPFGKMCARPGSEATVATLLRDALEGTISAAQIPVRCPEDQRDLLIAVDFRRVRVARARSGVLLTIHGWSHDDSVDTPTLGDLTYSISLAKFGVLRWVRFAGERGARTDFAGKLCFEALFERDQPCDGCPMRGAATRRAGVVRGPALTGTHPYVVTGGRVDSVTALLTAAAVDDSMLQRIVRIQTERRAQEAGLSPRERQVLELILLGRSVSEIAVALRIATSTAKFHKANTLRKLEIDSAANLHSRLL